MALYSNNSLKLLTILAFIAINCLAANLKSIANRDKSQQRRVGNNFRDNNGHRVRKNKHWFNVNLNDTDSVKKSALFMKYGSMYGGGYGGGGYGMNTYGGYGGYGGGGRGLSSIFRRVLNIFGLGGGGYGGGYGVVIGRRRGRRGRNKKKK